MVDAVWNEGAQALLVGSVASRDDIATGEPFSGADGRALYSTLLEPAGLRRSDVSLAVLSEDLLEQIEKRRPRVVVALGRDAARALGGMADIRAPHPAAVRKLGDTGQMARKARKLRAALRDNPVRATKSDALQIVYGAVLDPYGNTGSPEADAHDDWVDPKAVQGAAHAYLCRSRVVGIQHMGVAYDAEVVESWVEQYPTPEDYRAAMDGEPHSIWRRPFGDSYAHSGSWWLGVYLPESLWQAYLDGKINAFSPGGMLTREDMPESEMPEVTVVELAQQTNT